MGKPATLLEKICEHDLSFGADSLDVAYRDGPQWVFANHGGVGSGIANFKGSSREAQGTV